MSYVYGDTLDTTYVVQTQSSDGSWFWESASGEFTTEAEAHDLGGRMFGGEVTYRVVTITRSAGEAVNPR